MSNSPGVIVFCTTGFDNQGMGGTSNLGISPFGYMSNWPGVGELCSTRFNWGGCTSDLSTSVEFHISNSPCVIVLCTTRFYKQGVGVEGTPDLGTSAFCHMSNWPGVVGLCSTRLRSSEGTSYLKRWPNASLGHMVSGKGGQLIWGYMSSENMT